MGDDKWRDNRWDMPGGGMVYIYVLCVNVNILDDIVAMRWYNDMGWVCFLWDHRQVHKGYVNKGYLQIPSRWYVHHAVFSANNLSTITIGIADNYNALGMTWIAKIAAKIYHFDCTSLPSEIEIWKLPTHSCMRYVLYCRLYGILDAITTREL